MFTDQYIRNFHVCVTDPDLIYEKCLERSEGFEKGLELFPSDYTTKVVRPELSGNHAGV